MRKQLTLQDLINGTQEPNKKVRLAFAAELEKQSRGLAWRTVEEIKSDMQQSAKQKRTK